MILSLNFGNIFILISLNTFDIESKEKDLNIDKLENFNISIQTHLASEGEYEEFTGIKINLNTIKNDGEEHLYNEDNLYLESNNVGYNNIIQMNCIYNYYIFHLRFKITNNFFFKAIFKPIKKIYRKEETRYWIFTTRTTIYRTFILSFKHLSIYIKERAILKRC